MGQIARLKQQRFLSPAFFKIQRSYEKNHVHLLFHWFSGENCIIFTFLYTKNDRLRQIKKKHEWWNNRKGELCKKSNLKGNLIELSTFLKYGVTEVKKAAS